VLPTKSLGLIVERAAVTEGAGDLSEGKLSLPFFEAGFAAIISVTVGPCMLLAGIVLTTRVAWCWVRSLRLILY